LVNAAEATCPECGGAGWILTEDGGGRSARECGCRKASVRRGRQAAAEIPERYRECSFEDFRPILNNTTLINARKVAQDFAEAFPFVDNESGLLFMGNSGVGKTHLAIAILNYVTQEKGLTGRYVDFSDLLLRIQSTFKSDSPDSKEDLIAPYVDVELLVLDELGATKPTDFTRDMLYSLLNQRYNRRRITVATTNYFDEPPKGEREKLEDRIGYRLRSRLHEMCRTVLIEAQDYRRAVNQAGFRPFKRG
jgi:DNA replication protein DnaC